MRNLVKNKKKKGFTLIEMVAVVAIIGILAAILVPKVTGYMNEAKKTKAVDQARKVVQAFESAKMKQKLTTTDEGSSITTLVTNATFKAFLLPETADTLATVLPNLDAGLTYTQCASIVNGTKDFSLGNDDILQSGEIK